MVGHLVELETSVQGPCRDTCFCVNERPEGHLGKELWLNMRALMFDIMTEWLCRCVGGPWTVRVISPQARSRFEMSLDPSRPDTAGRCSC